MLEAAEKLHPICSAYPGVKILNGCAMDEASYEKHKNADAPVSPMTAQEAPADIHDPFEQAQDLHAIAAKAIEEHRAAVQPKPSALPAAVYQPSAAQYVSVTTESGETERRLVFSPTVMYFSGSSSGSYVTSGSYTTSGSYLTSGSYINYGSFSSGGSFSAPAVAETDEPYAAGSDMHLLGGYGIDII